MKMKELEPKLIAAGFTKKTDPAFTLFVSAAWIYYVTRGFWSRRPNDGQFYLNGVKTGSALATLAQDLKEVA